MRTLFLFFTIFVLSCSKEETVTIADPTPNITGKWWCQKAGSTNTIASQYFDSNGSWEQGSKGGTFNDKGKWKLSSDKKTIIISDVVDNNKKAKSGWEYKINSSTAAALNMTFSSFNIVMDMEPCK